MIERLVAVLGLVLCVSALPLPAAGATVVTLRAPENINDQRNLYVEQALRLALDKTAASDGPYRIERSVRMNKQRALVSAQQRLYPNFVLVAGFEEGRAAAGLRAVRFPLMLGVVGYRVCFVSPQARAEVEAATELAQLRRFRIGQGLGWTDVGILRANGFKVSEVGDYDNLFGMVSRGHVDLFCRSLMEVRHEAMTRKDMAGLQLDRSFALVYELPQFLFIHESHRAVAERIERGLLAAYRDGSLLALLRSHLRPALGFAELGKRRLYRLESPAPKGLDFDYRHYQLDLTREKP